MNEFIIEQDRVRISIKSILVGQDLCIIISGGDVPHIGCVTLSICGGSMHSNINSCTTSVLNLSGHKDDKVAKYIADKVSPILNRNVVIIGGMHVDNIEPKEIDFILSSSDKIAERIIDVYNIV